MMQSAPSSFTVLLLSITVIMASFYLHTPPRALPSPFSSSLSDFFYGSVVKAGRLNLVPSGSGVSPEEVGGLL